MWEEVEGGERGGRRLEGWKEVEGLRGVGGGWRGGSRLKGWEEVGEVGGG